MAGAGRGQACASSVRPPSWLTRFMLLLCTTSGCGAFARLQNVTLPITPPGGFYTVCTAPNNPFVNCTVGLYPSDASGYEIEVFKRVALQIGLRTDQYYFVCMAYSALVNDLVDPNGVCDMTAAGYTFFVSRIVAGVKLVFPEDYRTGLQVMVHAGVKQGGQWLFLKPFEWQVWLFLLCAAIVVGVSVHLVEILAKRHMSREIHNEFRFSGAGGFFDSMWAAVAQVADAGDPVAGVSFPARLIIFVWCFLILLLLTIYTGNAAAILTTTSINSDITSASDLRGRSWGTYVGSAEILKQQGLVPTKTYPIDNQAQQQAVIDALLHDDVEAMVLECGLVSWVTSFNCDLQPVGDCFAPQDQGISFWQNASDASVALTGLAVAQLEEAGDLDRLRDAFISPGSVCSRAVTSGTRSVTFSQVSGLWIVLGASIGIAFVFALILYHVHKRAYLKELRRRTFLKRTFARRKRSRSGGSTVAVDAAGVATCQAPSGGLELEAGGVHPAALDLPSPLSIGEISPMSFDESGHPHKF